MAHVLCVLILITRIGDLLSTRLVTPTLKLEANPFVRRLGWRFGLATLPICLVPYYNTALGFMVLMMGLFICFWNTSRMWMARTLGEAEYEALLLELARRSTLRSALVPQIVNVAFLAAIATLFMLFSRGVNDWSFWGGLGLLSTGISVSIYQTLFFVRLYKKARAGVTGEALSREGTDRPRLG